MNTDDYLICFWKLENRGPFVTESFGPFVQFMSMNETTTTETIARTVFHTARTSREMTDEKLFTYNRFSITTNKIPSGYAPRNTNEASEVEPSKDTPPKKVFSIKEQFILEIGDCFKTIIQEARANARKQQELVCT